MGGIERWYISLDICGTHPVLSFSMDPRKELLALADIHTQRTGLARATVASKAANDGKFFDRIEAGGDFGMRIYEKVKNWFQENTPAQN